MLLRFFYSTKTSNYFKITRYSWPHTHRTTISSREDTMLSVSHSISQKPEALYFIIICRPPLRANFGIQVSFVYFVGPSPSEEQGRRYNNCLTQRDQRLRSRSMVRSNVEESVIQQGSHNIPDATKPNPPPNPTRPQTKKRRKKYLDCYMLAIVPHSVIAPLESFTTKKEHNLSFFALCFS